MLYVRSVWSSLLNTGAFCGCRGDNCSGTAWFTAGLVVGFILVNMVHFGVCLMKLMYGAQYCYATRVADTLRLRGKRALSALEAASEPRFM